MIVIQEPHPAQRLDPAAHGPLKLAILKRDRFLCQFPGCGHRHRSRRRRRLQLQMHHIIPRSWGGVDEAGNLVALCRTHHRLVDDLLGVHRVKGRVFTH
jgi:5-methylcytosine-specific restriction endonuclease McrA